MAQLGGVNGSTNALPPPLPRRVSYVLPPPSSPPPLLSLPPISTSRRGHVEPIYTRQQGQLPAAYVERFNREQNAGHPRHRLAVQALALDLLTPLSGRSSGASDDEPTPAGLLYTGGRDGLLCSWELGLPTKRRKRAYGVRDPDEDAMDLRDDSDSDLEASEDEFTEASATANGLNLNGLGRRPVSIASQRQHSSKNAPKPRRSSSMASTATQRGNKSEEAIYPHLPLEDRFEVDTDRLRSGPVPTSKFRQCIQSHTDWINDIVLCNYNRTLVSASSDSLVLAWRPHAMDHEEQVTPMQVGRHGDYVRCLAGARDAHWVASGGFDRKIRLWDVGESRSSAVLELPSPPASVYSLASTPSGSLLAAGTPERVVRVWDPRSRKQVARLGGHTDNVRGVLLGEEGKWLLSASSDATVKLWSLAAQKCLHTFSHHTSSVWSLFSQHPNLEIFYSGDRDGNVCKIDLEGTGDPGEGECLLLARDGPESSDSSAGREGITQLVAQDDSYVWTAGGSSSIKRWKDIAPRSRRAGAITTRRKEERSIEHRHGEDAARSSTPEPQQSIAESPVEAGLELSRPHAPSVSFLEGLTTDLTRTTSSPTSRTIGSASPPVHRPSSLRTRPSATSSASQTSRPLAHTVHSNSQSSTSSKTLFDVPYDSLIPLTQPEDTYFSSAFLSRARDPDAATIYSSASILSVPHFGMGHRPSMSTSPPSSSFRRPQSVRSTGDAHDVHPTNIARRDFLDREDCSEAIPLRSAPDEIIAGQHGLVRCEVLNDRRHVLTIDTEEEVALWDIVRGRCVGVFAPEELVIPSRRPSDAFSSMSGTGSNGSDSVNGADILEYVRERIEGEAAIATWCKCDARVGSLTVHLEEARVFDGEVYADEAGLEGGEGADLPPDHRLSLGKWVLRNLFDGFVEAETELRAGGGTPKSPQKSTAPTFIPLPPVQIPTSPSYLKSPGMTIALATPALKKALLPDLSMLPPTSPRNGMWDLAPIPQSPGGTPRPYESVSSRTQATTPGGAKTPTIGRGAGEGDYFSLPPARSEPSPSTSQAPPLPAPLPTPTPRNEGTIMGRLRMLGKGTKRATADVDLPTLASPAPQPEVIETRTIEEQQQHQILESVFSRPISPAATLDAPNLDLDRDMAVIISEEKDQGAAWQVTYRGLVGTGRADLTSLEQHSPLWLLDFLLGNRILAREPVKISFLIQPWKGEGRTSLPELPNANARLTASRNLRLKKVTSYIGDKLELKSISSRAPSISSSSGSAPEENNTGAAASGTPTKALPQQKEHVRRESGVFDPEQELEILVGDVVLPLNVTLAAARAFYWKQGGDLVISYRTKL